MRRALALGAALILVLAGTALAQTQTGTITGKVTDPDGAPLPGVAVTVESPALIQPQTRVTGPGGVYTFVSLPVGTYTLTFRLEGFKTVEIPDIRLSIGFIATVDVRMELAAVEETITVTGQSPLVDIKSNTKSYSVDEQILENVPSGRHIWSISEMIPGVQPGNFDIGGTEGMQQYSFEVHGSRTDQNSFNIDGLKLNWPGAVGGGFTMMYYDFSMFSEIAFQTNLLPAEIQAGGIFLNMVTGSGGNELHFDGYAYWANDEMQRDNIDPELEARGGSQGNPLDQSYDLNATVGGPVVANRLWFFGAARWWRLDKVRLGVFDAAGRPAVDDNRIRNLYGKLTWQADADNKLSVGFNNNWKDRFHRQSRGWFTAEEATVLQDQPAHSVQGQWTSVLSDSAFLDIRLGRMWGVFPLRYQKGLVGPDDIAKEDVGRRFRSGAAPFGEFENPNDRTQLNASLSYFEDEFAGGYHDIKFGYQFSDQTMERIWRQNGDILWRFNNGVPLEVVISNTPVNAISKLRDWGIYAQDNWTIADRLTLNLGVRVSGVRGWLPAQSSPAGTFVGERSFPEVDDLPNLQGDVAPRLGFTLDLRGDGRTALKGGFARYYSQFGAGIAESLNPNNRTTGRRAWTDLNGDLVPQEEELGPFTGFGGGINRRLDPNLKTPFEDELTVGVEHQLSEVVAFGVHYFNRRARDQFGTRNLLRPTSAYSGVVVFDPFNNTNLTVWNLDPALVGLVDNLTTNVDDLDREYNGVELTLNKRWADNWQLMAGLTIGKNEGGLGGFGTDFNNPNNLIKQKGVIGNDATYTLKLVGSYLAPYGIHISGNYRYLTGYPLDRNLFVRGLNQGTQVIRVARRGDFRRENVSILDLRFGKVFETGPGSVEVTLDLYNALNSNAVLSEVQTVGPALGRVVQVVAPILLRIGAAVRF